MKNKVRIDDNILLGFGGGFYKVNPLHPYLLPSTAIIDFLNTHATHTNKIIEYCQKYMPFTLQITSADFKESIKDGFQKVKYELDDIFKKVIQNQPLVRKEIMTINKYLSQVHPKLSSYDGEFTRWVDEHNIWTIAPINSGEAPEISSKVVGHPVEAKNEAKIEITITRPVNSKALWTRSVMSDDTKSQLAKGVPDIDIDDYRYKDHKLTFDDTGNILGLFITLQHQEPIGFKLKDLSALMDIRSFESLLALQLWKMVNDPKFRKKFKVCAGGCGAVHKNKGPYCNKKSCSDKYHAMKRKAKYAQDQTEREKRKEATIKSRKKNKS